jgi:predicted dithiol-disulfide oxidoreductase (DUF899 family)
MSIPRIVTADEWLAARQQLLAQEKAFTKQRDALTKARQALPWVKVEKKYLFEGPRGPVSLSDLFDGRSQLIVYHFMFHPSWDVGCASCSFFADSFNGVICHLNARDVSMVAISKATIDQIEAYRKRLGWSFAWVSSHANEFNRDYHVSFSDQEVEAGKGYYNYGMNSIGREEMPGMSVFFRDDSGGVFHTYSSYARGLEIYSTAYHYLDTVPKGRDEDDMPWNQAWIKRNDEY